MAPEIKKNVVLGIFVACLGAFIGGTVWLLLWVMDLGITALWQRIPQSFSVPAWYPLAVCAAGGVFVGLLQKKWGPCPKELSEVMGETRRGVRQPYDKLPALALCALVPLIFGGSLGPEAGLTGVIAGLCYWLADRFKTTYAEVEDLAQVGIAATLGAVFRAPLFGFANAVDDPEGKTAVPKNSKTVMYFIAILSGFAVHSLLTGAFGGGMGMGRFSGMAVNAQDWIAMIPLGIAGALCGWAYHGFGRLAAAVMTPVKSRPVLRAVLGGLLLGGAGMVLPYTMWAGESQMTVLMDSWQSLPVWVLIATGIVKLFMTNWCIETGWRGGNIFPVIFSGICIGYGIAALIPVLDPVFTVAVVVAGLCGGVMRKPIAVVMLLMICFPVEAIVPLCVGAFIAAAIPMPAFLAPKSA